MKFRSRLFSCLAFCLLFAVAGCGGGPSTGESMDTTPARDPSPMDYIKISEGPCFGACPVYDFTLKGDGRVVFHGNRFSKVSGQHLASRSVGQFLDALETLKAHDFESLAGVYDPSSCKMAATDHPTIHVEVKSEALTGNLQWYTGCRGLEERVALERMVDELKRVLDVEEFIGTDADRSAMRRR
ncbi:DUF6438 domain-containing protein [Kordiimonas aestuarii]|uniref:DUF6438 domain-containing protein n=1 Tax=Kordiimonas aestuarii TaxID=1005925 RepID=UPI0021D1E634|nr:DUF6438 domain-containing protein [Kordiimonas aestuarii]